MKNIFICFIALLCYKYGYTQQTSIQSKLKALFEEKDDLKLKSALKSYIDSRDETGLIVAVNYYTYKSRQQTADSLKQIAVKKFPNGDLAYNNALERFQSLESYKEKLGYHHQIIEGFFGRDFSSLNGMLILEAIDNKDCDVAISTFAKLTDATYIHYLIPTLCEKLILGKETNGDCLNAFLQSLLEQYKHIIKGSMVSENAPNITLNDLNGQAVSLDSLKGKIVILDFWATWCKPCIQSFPGMQAALEKYRDNPNIVFLFVNTAERGTEDPSTAVKKIIEENQYSFRVLMDKKDKVSKRFTALESFKVNALPTKYIIDQQGMIRFKMAGSNGGSKFIQEEIRMMIDAIN